MKWQNFEPKQKKRLFISFFTYLLVGSVILVYFCYTLYAERLHAREGWGGYLADDPEQAAYVASLAADATPVTVGTYVENLREMNMKSSYFRVEFQVWFLWEGDEDLDVANNFRIYKGVVHTKQILKEQHENGRHYQLVSMDASVSKDFDTKRFPLESHQMRFYVESTSPVQEVVFVPDETSSGMNPNLTLGGYEFLQHDIGVVSFSYDSTHGDPRLENSETNSELVTAFEVNRESFGTYFKCFIALAGTITWALISLFICTYHHVDPLGMIPGALFGTVSNIMIGASLLPDALELGLLEYVNLWGVLCILGATVAIININQARKKAKGQPSHEAFSHFYGIVMFYTVLVFSVGGQVLLPLFAYIR